MTGGGGSSAIREALDDEIARDAAMELCGFSDSIDIPGAIGTPIYATADGIIAKAEWFGGYGNFIQIAHGNSIETRYGHMSRLNVQAGDRVRKGQIIGFMGSTGRSTGSHLHYEVRIDGDAVNPLSFVPPRDIMLAARDESAVGGPSND